MMRRLVLSLTCTALCSVVVTAALAKIQNEDINAGHQSMPSVRVDEFLDAQLDGTLELVDHEGQTVTVNSLFANGKPTVLTFVYYRCPAACTLLLNGLTLALKDAGFTLGRDFNLVTISVDSRETTDLAKAKRDTYLTSLPNTEHDPSSWRFFTGSRSVIEELTNTVGYRFVYDPDSMQYEHPSVLMFVSPDRKVKRYLYGSYFQPDNVRRAFIESSGGALGTLLERTTLLFYDFGTPESGRRYVFNSTRFGITLLLLSLCFSLILWRVLIWSRRRFLTAS